MYNFFNRLIEIIFLKTRAYSLTVKHTAHNGKAVGSNPTTLIQELEI